LHNNADNLKILKKTLQEDAKLKFASNEEKELRLKYPFANVFIQFPTTGESVSFPAYMKGLQDSFSPKFNSIDVFGRVDPIPVFQGTSRAIGFSLVMPAYKEEHARQILADINTIAKNLYPSYLNTQNEKTKIINSPPLIRVKFANLICDYTNPSRGLLGYVNGTFNITHGMETNGMFLVDAGDGDGAIYVKTYEVSFNINILHEGTPGFNERGEFLDGDNSNGQFPYTLDTSGQPFFKEQSDGSADSGATSTDVSRQAGSNNSGLGSEAVKASNKLNQGR
tara:strand:+ start:3031 stop:3873 length:843 start_codon:yes stop_codon:yes gene_type:complete